MDGGEQVGGRVALPRERISRVRRAVTFLAVTGFHALLLIALLRLAGAPPGAPVGTLTVFSLAPPSNAAPAPPKAAKPEKPRPRKKDGERNAPEIVPAAAMPSTRGEVCEPLEAVSLALAGDEAAREALDALPSEAMGIANSIAVWTTDWNDVARLPSGPLLPVRSAIETALAALPQACLETSVSNPIFYPYSTGRRDYVLVFGSGEWRWNQLVFSPLNVAEGGPAEHEPSLLERIFAPY